jgi:hypothetical protein
MSRHVNQQQAQDPNTCLIINSTKAREATKTRNPALSPNSLYLYSPYLSPPLATSTKKESKSEVERKDPAVR